MQGGVTSQTQILTKKKSHNSNLFLLSLIVTRKKLTMMPRQVRFGTVEFKEFPVILGDHPGCKAGPPIELSWDAENRFAMDMDLYELSRPRRRSRRQLILSSSERFEMLRNRVFLFKLEATVSTTTIKLKTRRKKSNEECKKVIDDIDETLSRLTDRLNNLLKKMSPDEARRQLRHRQNYARCANSPLPILHQRNHQAMEAFPVLC
jgi:hypothetical protein